MTENVPSYVPSDDAKKHYWEYIAETSKRELSGIDNFDKSILTLSSAGLGLSMSFLKDFVGVAVVWPWFLYVSWGMFGIATLSTMASFMVSGKALEYQKKLAYRGYIRGEDAAFDEPNKWNQITICLNYVSATAFFSALILTIAFVIINLEGNRMASGSYKPATSSHIEQRGANVPVMQRPASAPSQPASAPTTPSGGNSK